MYHDVVSPGAEDASGFPGRDAASYKVTVERFTEHLDAIMTRVGSHLSDTGAGARLRSPATVASYGGQAPGRRSATREGGSGEHGRRRFRTGDEVALTFDDGGISALTAADYLELYGLRGYFFVTANYIGTNGFLDVNAMRDLDRRGHIVGSHSCSHPLRLGHASWSQLLGEWTRSRAIISDVLGHAISVASVPGGDYGPAVARAAGKAGFTELFTSEPTARDHHAFGVTLHGRFTIRRWTSARTASALAAGDWMPRMRQAAVWSAAKIGKHLAGRSYLRVREVLMGRNAEVRWGDQQSAINSQQSGNSG